MLPLFQTIVKFIDQLGWKYVVVVYTENSYGRGAYQEIRPQLAGADICLTLAISADPNDISDAATEMIFRKILETNATAVIYLGNSEVASALLEKGETYNGAGMLQWVVTDSVSLGDRFLGQTYPRGL